jgi:SAM-dependent methyltransferase
MRGTVFDEAVVWHEVECGSYAADLRLWSELAATRDGPVLELGAGTGRVALELAAAGRSVTAIDSDPALVGALRRRARERGLQVDARPADARAFALGRHFELVIAPMQLVQLLGGASGRRAMLDAVRRHARPGSVLAVAVADPLEGASAADALPPLPDVRQLDGWVYSSRPVSMRDDGDGIVIERVREAVSPTGELRQSAATLRLDKVDPDELAGMAVAAGFSDRGRREVPATDAYVGSSVVILEAT